MALLTPPAVAADDRSSTGISLAPPPAAAPTPVSEEEDIRLGMFRLLVLLVLLLVRTSPVNGWAVTESASLVLLLGTGGGVAEGDGADEEGAD